MRRGKEMVSVVVPVGSSYFLPCNRFDRYTRLDATSFFDRFTPKSMQEFCKHQRNDLDGRAAGAVVTS